MINIHENAIAGLKFYLPSYITWSKKLKNNEGIRFNLVQGLCDMLFDIQFLKYYKEENIRSITWYNAAVSTVFCEFINQDRFFKYPTKIVSSVFLSDNPIAIGHFTNYDFKLHKSIQGVQIDGPMPITSYLLNGQKLKAEKEFEYWMNSQDYKDNIAFSHQLDRFYGALLSDDPNEIEKSVYDTFTKKYQKFFIQYWHLSEEYTSTCANFCGKLCHMLGYEIEFDHPLLDMDLIRINPLEHYPTLEEIEDHIRELAKIYEVDISEHETKKGSKGLLSSLWNRIKNK